MIQDPDWAHLTHYLFEWLALAAGFALYRFQRKQRGAEEILHSAQFPILIACILGAGIGNKLVAMLEQPQFFSDFNLGLRELQQFFMGQSIVGGLLGGWVGVEIGKWVTCIKSRTGDDFVRPILLGIVIGRVGCFLAGLHDGTFGIPTSMPWGIDFGDGKPRHPTQLYECLLALLGFVSYPRWQKFFKHEAGLSFRVLMTAYLLWRLFIELYKPLPYTYPLGLSGIQWVCLVGLAYLVLEFLHTRSRFRSSDE